MEQGKWTRAADGVGGPLQVRVYVNHDGATGVDLGRDVFQSLLGLLCVRS